MPPGYVTLLLQRFQAGDSDAASELMNRIYPELKRVARIQLAHEHQPHDLQPTALVHEAYMRLVGQTERAWENRGQFFAAAANTMRRILVDNARARLAQKRNGLHVSLPTSHVMDEAPASTLDLLELDAALVELAQLSPRQARVVELRYFAGLSIPQIAASLGVNPRSVDRDWATARAWLRARLSE